MYRAKRQSYFWSDISQLVLARQMPKYLKICTYTHPSTRDYKLWEYTGQSLSSGEFGRHLSTRESFPERNLLQ